MLEILPCGGKMPRSLGRQCEVHSDRSSASPVFLSAVCGSIRRSSASYAPCAGAADTKRNLLQPTDSAKSGEFARGGRRIGEIGAVNSGRHPKGKQGPFVERPRAEAEANREALEALAKRTESLTSCRVTNNLRSVAFVCPESALDRRADLRRSRDSALQA